MKINKQLSLTILAVTIMIINTEAQQSEKKLADKQKEILSWLTEYHVSAIGIGIIENGQLAECKVFGELRKGIPAHDSAIFTMASLTKPVVAMVTLKLVEHRQWDLDEPLTRYWAGKSSGTYQTENMLCYMRADQKEYRQ